MAGVLQAVVRLDGQSGLPEDVFENVLHFGIAGSAPSSGDVTAILEDVRDFYTVDPGAQTAALSSYISLEVIRGGHLHSILAYYTEDFSGATPMGSPVGQLTFDLGAQGNSTYLPTEVAVVLSYNGDLTDVPVSEENPDPPPATIRPQQRRRGRLFFGPLTGVSGSIQGSHFRPTLALRTDLGIAFDNLYHQALADGGGQLGVWSKADETVYTVVHGYVDDAWDTQRRRGIAPSTRTEFTVS